ncbi:hypothetical protein MANES_02G136400v8 [Manihot esculenta]|uniref:RIN4 pathogenic type III effector avirulence factor Avr cleavage site domain-containing protein n=1 Tax=Manihot esculenta TaxID=3983 RepID=A0A2C9WDN5_MANES|nr:hypothetical protein MANES_02G136400v8 [Manihot esculenta]
MEKQEKNGWTSVPQFGGWDSKTPVNTDYSVVFQQARANRKQQKRDIKHPSLGNEREFAHTQQDDSVMRKKKILTYINCCIKP